MKLFAGDNFQYFAKMMELKPTKCLTILNCLYSLHYFCTAALRMWSFNV